jgi:hypothetical protein
LASNSTVANIIGHLHLATCEGAHAQEHKERHADVYSDELFHIAILLS